MKIGLKLNLDKKSDRFLVLLILADAVFIVLHFIFTYTGLLSNDLFSLKEDRGYGEVFQYVKEFWIVLLLFYFAIRKSNFLFFSWSLLFFYLLIDDTFMFRGERGLWIRHARVVLDPDDRVANLEPGKHDGFANFRFVCPMAETVQARVVYHFVEQNNEALRHFGNGLVLLIGRNFLVL